MTTVTLAKPISNTSASPKPAKLVRPFDSTEEFEIEANSEFYPKRALQEPTIIQPNSQSAGIKEAAGTIVFESLGTAVNVAEKAGKVAQVIISKDTAKIAVEAFGELGQQVFGSGQKAEQKKSPEEEQKILETLKQFQFNRERTSTLTSELKQAAQVSEAKEQTRLGVEVGALTAEKSGYTNKSFIKVDTKSNRMFALVKLTWFKIKEQAKKSAESLQSKGPKGPGVDLRQASVGEKAGSHVLSSAG